LQIREAPSTAAIASNLHGTVAWEAAKGAYCVCTQQTVDNPLSGVFRQPVIRLEKGAVASGEYFHGTKVTFSPPAATPSLILSSNNQKCFPFNTHGVMVTGLNASSTLRVRLRVYVERAPGCGTVEQALAVLATPSAGFDSAALKVYSEVVARMPVAVPVDMNAWGDWWKVISGLIKTVAVPVGTMLGGPAGGLIGGGISAAITAADNFAPRPNGAKRGPVPATQNPGSVAYKKKNKNQTSQQTKA
jgi:hypothetical protein